MWLCPMVSLRYDNTLKTGAHRVPLYRSGLGPLLKRRWVEIKRDGSCFALWQDVGPWQG